MTGTVVLGVLGDIHTQFDQLDADVLDAQAYDAILAVGDLASLRPGTDIETARGLAALKTRTFVHPGNHDATTPAQLFAEVTGSDFLAEWCAQGQAERVAELRAALGLHTLTGYSRHSVGGLSVVAGRPHSFGGTRLGCAAYLERAFGIDGFEASAARIEALVAEAPSDVVVLAHNGPFGLGDGPGDIWGCDFRSEPEDFGDPDLAAALASPACLRVRAVVAGHMHHRVKGTKNDRTWAVERDGVLFVNAACVPRHRGLRRHHVRLEVGPSAVRAEQLWLGPDGQREVVAEHSAVFSS